MSVLTWLERIDPGSRGRAKGLRLVAAYGIAMLLGSTFDKPNRYPNRMCLPILAAGFALWACVSEDRATSRESCRDLALLVAAAGLGSVAFILLHPLLAGSSGPGPEMSLVLGSFLVGYLRGFGILRAGVGSQIYIGLLLAYNAHLALSDLTLVGSAIAIALASAIGPRFLFLPLTPQLQSVNSPQTEPIHSETKSSPLPMGMEAAIPGIIIVALNNRFGLEESAWAITASTYVVAVSRAATMERVRRRIFGTTFGVPLGLAFLPLAVHAPLLLWVSAAIAMVIYAVALPTRYDIACGAFAFMAPRRG